MHHFDTDRLGRIATWMQSYVDRGRFPGSSCLILQNGHEAYFHATGHRDLEAGTRFTRDTVVRIYSMTKPVTSVALMMLLEEGLVRLDTPLSDVLPEFTQMHALIPGATRIDQTEPAAIPNLQHCLTHTAGFTYKFNSGPLAEAMAEANLQFASRAGTLADQTTKLAALPLAFQPGKTWEYSVGIDVIGRVVEVVSGRPLDAFFDERIFAPLGMADTSFRVTAPLQDTFAALYTAQSDGEISLTNTLSGAPQLHLVEAPGASAFRDTTCFSGGGGLVSTLDDYARFAEMLRRGGSLGGERLLSPSTLAFMMRNHLPGEIASLGPASFAEQPMEGMGFGIGGAVVLDPARARIPGSVGDFSWGGLASTFFWVDPVYDLSCIFFTQLMPSSRYPARSELKALVHGALI